MNTRGPGTDPCRTPNVCHLSAVIEEFCHPAGSTAINSEPSSQNVHEDGMVSGIEGGRQIEQDQGTDVT